MMKRYTATAYGRPGCLPRARWGLMRIQVDARNGDEARRLAALHWQGHFHDDIQITEQPQRPTAGVQAAAAAGGE